MIKSKNNLGKKLQYSSKRKRTDKYVKYKKNEYSKKLRGGAGAGAGAGASNPKYRPVYRTACRSVGTNQHDDDERALLRKQGRIMNKCAYNEYWHFKNICGIGPDIPKDFLVCKKKDSDEINKKKTIRNRLCADLRSSFNKKCINKTLSKKFSAEFKDMKINTGEHGREVNKASRQGRECFNLITDKPDGPSRAELREDLRVKILQSSSRKDGRRYPLKLNGDRKDIFASNEEIDLGSRLADGALINSNNSSQNINNIRNRWDVNTNRTNTILTSEDGACNNAPDPTNNAVLPEIRYTKLSQKNISKQKSKKKKTSEEPTLKLSTSSVGLSKRINAKSKHNAKSKPNSKSKPTPDPPCSKRKCGNTKPKCLTTLPKSKRLDGHCMELRKPVKKKIECKCVNKQSK